MKLRILPFLLSAAALAQEPPKPAVAPSAPSPVMSIQASGVGAGQNVQKLWETSWGSYDKAYERTRNILVYVRAWGKPTTPGQKVEGVLETYWFGRTLTDMHERVLIRVNKTPIQLTPGAASRGFFESSGVVQGGVTNYEALGEKYVSGAKIEGWYVRVVDSTGKRICDTAGASHLIDLCRDPEKLAKIRKLDEAD